MQKTKRFTQFSGNNFSISVQIGIKGNVVERNIINTYGEYSKQKSKKWVNDNKEHKKEYDKKYYILNREKRRKHDKKYSLQYRKDNKEKIRELLNQYRKNNPEKVAVWRQSRRGWGTPEPINEYLKGSHLHHTHRNGDHREAIFIPIELHKSIIHAHNRPETMNKINKLAFEWLGNQ